MLVAVVFFGVVQCVRAFFRKTFREFFRFRTFFSQTWAACPLYVPKKGPNPGIHISKKYSGGIKGDMGFVGGGSGGNRRNVSSGGAERLFSAAGQLHGSLRKCVREDILPHCLRVRRNVTKV